MDEYGTQFLTPQGISELLANHPSTTQFVVAYSGGVDSHVLLDLMAEVCLSTHLTVSALHIHHGLSKNADLWAQHCEKICAKLQVPLTVIWVDATMTEGRSPEEIAREARFTAFEKFLRPNECLLLAHHAEDQAETILLRLFRGAGPQGLGGMAERATLGEGEIFRPLLTVAKEDILKYARSRNLQWVEDESNQNTAFDRNFLRQEILPKLTHRWPRVVRSVSRSGALCLETATAIQELAKQDFMNVAGSVPESLSIVSLLKLDFQRRKAVIRFWLQLHACLPPSRDHMHRIDQEILQAKPDAKPKLKLGDYELRRHKKDLILIKLAVSQGKRFPKMREIHENSL